MYLLTLGRIGVAILLVLAISSPASAHCIVGDRFFTPTVFAGKGFGFLPESMKFFKPFAITAQLGYAIPTESSTSEFDKQTGLVTTMTTHSSSIGVDRPSIACRT